MCDNIVFIYGDECSICLSQLIYHYNHGTPDYETYGLVITNCEHIFHLSCLNKIINNKNNPKCPLCRNNICNMEYMFFYNKLHKIENIMMDLYNIYFQEKDLIFKHYKNCLIK
jgi:hypothetical protein